MLEPLKNALGSWEQRFASQPYRQFQIILSRWSDVVGEHVAGHSKPISLQGQVLRVSTSSSTWCQTLMFERPRIMAKLNVMLSMNLTDIRFQPGMLPLSNTAIQNATSVSTALNCDRIPVGLCLDRLQPHRCPPRIPKRPSPAGQNR
jgi:hypothetical protein